MHIKYICLLLLAFASNCTNINELGKINSLLERIDGIPVGEYNKAIVDYIKLHLGIYKYLLAKETKDKDEENSAKVQMNESPSLDALIRTTVTVTATTEPVFYEEDCFYVADDPAVSELASQFIGRIDIKNMAKLLLTQTYLNLVGDNYYDNEDMCDSLIAKYTNGRKGRNETQTQITERRQKMLKERLEYDYYYYNKKEEFYTHKFLNNVVNKKDEEDLCNLLITKYTKLYLRYKHANTPSGGILVNNQELIRILHDTKIIIHNVIKGKLNYLEFTYQTIVQVKELMNDVTKKNDKIFYEFKELMNDVTKEKNRKRIEENVEEKIEKKKEKNEKIREKYDRIREIKEIDDEIRKMQNEKNEINRKLKKRKRHIA